jgi:hypothetical protein
MGFYNIYNNFCHKKNDNDLRLDDLIRTRATYEIHEFVIVKVFRPNRS